MTASLHCTPESNRQAAEWTERDKLYPTQWNGQLARLWPQYFGMWYYIHRLPRKGPDYPQRV
jgi:hypothetical protein